MLRRLLLGAGLALAALAGAAAAADPGASDWARTDQSAVRLVSATSAASETLRLGLEFRLAPGWKTYWRSPGDAGYPPRVDWTGSANLADPRLRWPAPERFTLFGLETFGYGGSVVLPIEARTVTPGAPVAVRAKVEYLICETICIPYEAQLALDLPAGAGTLGPQAHAIDRFAARVPAEGAGAGLGIDRAEWRGSAQPGLVLTVRAVEPFRTPDVFVEEADPWVFGKPEVQLDRGGRSATFVLAAAPDPKAAAPIGREVRLTLVDGERAMERVITVTAAEGGAGLGLLAMLGIALLGGLVLNLMPCVLPVLSLKMFGILSQGGAARGAVRASFLATSAGIVTSFGLLAAALIALRAGGAVIGWGIQFQSPLFLGAMAVVLVVFAANLWGWFEIRLPAALSGVAAAGDGHGTGAAFLTGVFATLLATPCSAPFVRTAVGFALARGSGEILMIFAALGLGLAAPYLAVAAFPGLAARLPRPGRWMVPLRWILGAALLATALWLLDVLLAQRAWTVVAALAAVLAALLGLLWATRGGGRVAWLRPAGMAAAAAVALLLSGLGGAPVASTVEDAGPRLAWTPFSTAAIGEAVAGGQVVIVDVTADWCVTCQVNKRLVLDRGAVAERLAGAGIVRLRADWTRPDERIARFLEGFGRYGVPFNVVYGPGARDGIPLPELLTAEVVLAALDRARGGP